MVMIATTLANGLKAMTPTTNATAAQSTLADALINYFAGASVAGVPANPGVLAGAPKSAVLATLASLNSPNGAAASIAAACQAFWTAVGPIASTVWLVPPNTIVPASLVPPAGLGSLSTGLQSTFDSNVNGALDLDAAATAIANTIHSAQAGATVTLQPPPPAPPVVTPII